MILEAATLAAVLAAIGLVLAYTLKTGMPPTPTSPRVRAVVLEALPPDLEGTVYELGSGWGTLALPLARRHPGCTVVAYEIAPLPWLVSVLRRALARLPNLTIRRADFGEADLSDAAVVVCYLLPEAMKALRPKFEAELAPGAMVVSNFFAVPGWRASLELIADDIYRSKVHVYRMPAA